MKHLRFLTLFSAAALLLCACEPASEQEVSQDTDPLDAEDDGFGGGKEDGQGIEATPGEVCSILKLATGGSLEVLDINAGLNVRAVREILAWRAGKDGVEGTEDDEWFASLEELDEVKFVGKAAFKGLLRYVKAHPEVACGSVNVQLLAFNDYHGAMEPPSGSGGKITTALASGATPATTVDAGGVEYLATHVKAHEATNPNTLVVSAGDIIGATPLLSAAFHDEPSIESMNLLGLDVASVGNHEFDEGFEELLRMQGGGCHPVDGCYDEDGFEGAQWRYLAANVIREETGDTVLPGVTVRRFGYAKVGFIGLTLEGTPLVVTEAGARGLSFLDEAETINALVPGLKERGVNTIVVLIHEGGAATGLYDECAGISGPIFEIVKNLDPEVDVVISGHTNAAHICDIEGRLVTSAAHNGRLLTDIDLTIDEQTGQLTLAQADNVIVTRDVSKDGDQTALIQKYKEKVAPFANRVVGSLAGDLTRTAGPSGETTMGDVIADAQLRSGRADGAQIAFMNPGGVRGDLLVSAIGGGEQPGELTYSEIFSIQPFANNLIVLDLTGAQIERILEEQWSSNGQDRGTKAAVLQVSEGFSYTWDPTAPAGSRVDPASITLDGAPLELGQTYRVVANVFLAGGGDSFPTFREGVNRRSGAIDLDALEQHLGANPNLTPPALTRIKTR